MREYTHSQLPCKTVIVLLLAHALILDLRHECLAVVHDEIDARRVPRNDVFTFWIFEYLRPESVVGAIDRSNNRRSLAVVGWTMYEACPLCQEEVCSGLAQCSC